MLLNFWASWCAPCRKEFPNLKGVNGPDVHVIGVVFDDTSGNAASFMRAQSATWPAVVDPKAQIADAYGVHHKPGIPITFAISPSGILRATHFGPASDADLRALIASARR